MCSPLKEWYNFNKYVNTLRDKMAKKSPEDYQEQEATRDMKIQRLWKIKESRSLGHL